MTWYQILTVAGVPSLISLAVAWLVKKLASNIKRVDSDEQSVKKGVQALLRASMIDDYNHYVKKGYAPIYAKENFENCWQQYHALGANGVMDGLRAEFMNLPTEKAEKNKND